MNTDREYELMKRQVEAHERIADAQEIIVSELKKLSKVLVVNLSDGTVCVRVAQV